MWSIILLCGLLAAPALQARVQTRSEPTPASLVQQLPARGRTSRQPLRDLHELPAPRPQIAPASSPGDFPAPAPSLRAC